MCIGEDPEDSHKSRFFGCVFGKVYNVATEVRYTRDRG
jgi:hypothetical protein